MELGLAPAQAPAFLKNPIPNVRSRDLSRDFTLFYIEKVKILFFFAPIHHYIDINLGSKNLRRLRSRVRSRLRFRLRSSAALFGRALRLRSSAALFGCALGSSPSSERQQS